MIGQTSKRIFRILGILTFSVLCLCGVLSFGSSAQAAYGIPDEWGYFTQQPRSGVFRNRVIPSGVFSRNVADFKNEIRSHLFSGDPNRVTGAQFIILTMLGYNAGVDRNLAFSSLGEWEARVDGLASGATGSIDWYSSRVILCSELNSAYDPGLNDVTPTQSVDPSGCEGAPIETIRFYDRAGNLLYEIKRDCGNPLGDLPGIPALVPLTIGPCNVSTVPSDPEPGQQFRLNVSFTTSGGTGPDALYTITTHDFTEAGVPEGALAAYLGTVPRNGGVGSGTIPNTLTPGWPVIATAGTHTGSFRIQVNDATNSPRTCNFAVTIADKPFHQTYGGDTRVGSGFRNDADACTTDTNATFLGLNRGGAPNYTGAGSQLAAFAFGWIIDFSSGQLRTNVTQPKPLSFANTNPSRLDLGVTTYGGGLMDGQAVCAPNFYAGEDDQPTTPLGGSTPANIGPAVYTHGSQASPSNLVITGGSIGLGAGTRTIYVYGDVTITGNITYAGGNYNDIGNIPGFRLIVRGNIYVEPGVSQLDGIYIAQPHPDGSRGRFYTCGPGGAPPDAAELNGTCRTNRLTIYGAVLADLIKLTRSRGTLGQAAAPNATHSPTQSIAASTAAEVFIMTPEVWLTSDFSGGGEYDSITTLPPVL